MHKMHFIKTITKMKTINGFKMQSNKVSTSISILSDGIVNDGKYL
jgi:hypothetical protein